MVSLLTEDINEYLKYDEVIDFDKPEIKALADTLFDEVSSETDYVRHAFEYVRDTYPHSADINADEIAVSASDVLKIGHGICHAKSHLLAALLRCKGVPAGLCYQKLILDDETNGCISTRDTRHDMLSVGIFHRIEQHLGQAILQEAPVGCDKQIVGHLCLKTNDMQVGVELHDVIHHLHHNRIGRHRIAIPTDCRLRECRI